MIKYISHALTFAEVPDEISLCINVTNCPHNCPGCHSEYLRQDTGRDLLASLPVLLEKYRGDITCVCFMGEGNDTEALSACLRMVREAGLKTCLYTGSPQIPVAPLLDNLDYVKTGPYNEQCGPLTKPTTNQRMYKIVHNPQSGFLQTVLDITYRFWPVG